MRLLRRNMLAAAALSAAMLCSGGRPAAAAADPAVLAADRDFAQAAAKPDAAALGKLLDADFQWIDVNGKTANRAQVLGGVPKPAISDAGGRTYGGTTMARWRSWRRTAANCTSCAYG
jgi:hypothetical protein